MTSFIQRIILIIVSLIASHEYLLAEGLRIINYPPAEYRGYSQNWSVDQSSAGIMYFANTGGLLEYDGNTWTLHQSEDKLKYRSVSVASDSLIYTGSFEEFGYWIRDTKGRLRYHSLVNDTIRNIMHNDEIWNIIQHNDAVYFQSFSNIFKLSNDTVRQVKTPYNILFLSKVNDRVLVYVIADGIYELVDDQFELIEGTKVFSNKSVPVILPYRDNDVLIGTELDGLYKLTSEGVFPLNNEASEFVKKHQLNRGLVKKGGSYIFGTIQNGVIVCDSLGNINKVINQNKGLQNNTVLGMHHDNESGNLWLALNNGIDRVDLTSPYTIFIDEAKGLGAVFTGALYQNKLYLGTNQGVYYKPITDRVTESLFDGEFMLLHGTQGQVWDMSVQDDQLLIGHNQGTFALRNRDLSQISETTGGWDIKKMVLDGKEYLIQCTYTHLVIYYKNENDNWEKKSEISGLTEPIRHIVVDNRNQVWASHFVKGVYKLELSDDLKSIDKWSYYGKGEGFPSEHNIYVFKINGKVVFTTGEELYHYDALNDSILPYDILNKRMRKYANANRIINIGTDHSWLINNRAFILVSHENDKVEIEEVHPFRRFGDYVSEQNENVIQLNDSLFLFCLPNGFSIYNRSNKVSFDSSHTDRILLKKIKHPGGLLPLEPKGEPVAIPFNKSDLSFQVAAPVHNKIITGFQYKLEGLEEEWSEVNSSPIVHYTRVPHGTYTFKARYVDDLGNTYKPLQYPLIILKPWYLNTFAILGYLFLMGLIVILVRAYNKRKLDAKQRKLRIELERDKLAQLRKHRQEHEKQLMAIKNEKLQQEVNHKMKQLASSTMGVIKKNEVLIKIRDELLKHKKEIEQISGKPFVKSMFRIIENNLTEEEDWSVFEQNFDQAHEDFLKKLRSKYPTLTPKDLRFCAYLRMNLSSKEIASLLNITVRGVEVRRYRLRKKLELDHDQNLVDFLMGLT